MSFKHFKLAYLLLTLPSFIDPLCAAEKEELTCQLGTSHSTKYANLLQEEDGGLVVKMTGDLREEFRKNPQLIQKEYANPLFATMALFSEESLAKKEMVCKNLIHFRLQRYMQEASRIADKIFDTQYALTEKNLDVFLCTLNDLNINKDKRGVSAFLIRIFKGKTNEFSKNENLINKVVKESNLPRNKYFLKLGQEMVKKVDQIPPSLAEDYYRIVRPFWLSDIMDFSLDNVVDKHLSFRITPANIQQLHHIASTKKTNQKKEPLENLISFAQSCQVQDDWALSYQGSLLMYEMANLPRSEGFLNAMKAIEITELLKDSSELVHPYVAAFLTVSEAAQKQQLIDKFNKFTPELFTLYEKFMDSENPLDKMMGGFCNILFSSYVALLKQQNLIAIDERIEGFKTAALEAKEAKKESQETVQNKKIDQGQKRQKIEASLKATKEKNEKKEKARIALEELHKHHTTRNQQVSTSGVESLPLTLSNGLSIEIPQPSPQNFTKESKEAARAQIEKEDKKAEKHRQRVTNSTTTTTTTTTTTSTTSVTSISSSIPQEDKSAYEFDNSPDSLKKHLKERNSLVGELKPTPLAILKLFFETKNEKGQCWNNDVDITMTQLENVVKALKGKVDRSRGKGGHFMLFFGQKQVAELYNPAMALEHIDGPLASLTTTGKLWDSKRLPPYLIEQLRNIFITMKMVPTDFTAQIKERSSQTKNNSPK